MEYDAQVAFVDLDIKPLGKVPQQFALDRAIAEHASQRLEGRAVDECVTHCRLMNA